MLLVDIALRLQNELLSINPQLTDPPPMITMEFWSRTQLETFRHALRKDIESTHPILLPTFASSFDTELEIAGLRVRLTCTKWHQ